MSKKTKDIGTELYLCIVAAIINVNGIGMILSGKSVFEAFFVSAFLGVIFVVTYVIAFGFQTQVGIDHE